MGNVPARIHGVFSEEREAVVRETVDVFVSLARAPEIGGERTVPYSYSQEGTYVEDQSQDVHSVVDRLTEAGGGTVSLEYESLRFRVEINQPEYHTPSPPLYTIAIDSVYFEPDSSNESVSERLADLYELVVSVYTKTSPLHMFGYGPSPDYSYVTVPTRDELRAGELGDIYWLVVLRPDIVERLGRDKVLTVPAWNVEELDDGAVLVVVYQNPRIPGDEFDPAEVEGHLGL